MEFMRTMAASRGWCSANGLPDETRTGRTILKDYTSGKLPIPDLTNLDIYEEVGIELDRDDVEMQAVPDFLGLYRKALAAKAESLFVHADTRLWPGA